MHASSSDEMGLVLRDGAEVVSLAFELLGRFDDLHPWLTRDQLPRSHFGVRVDLLLFSSGPLVGLIS